MERRVTFKTKKSNWKRGRSLYHQGSRYSTCVNLGMNHLEWGGAYSSSEPGKGGSYGWGCVGGVHHYSDFGNKKDISPAEG